MDKMDNNLCSIIFAGMAVVISGIAYYNTNVILLGFAIGCLGLSVFIGCKNCLKTED